MPVKQEIPFSDGIFFITFTCRHWLPLIEISNAYQFVYDWYDYLKSKGHYVVGYAIMPNHIHSLIAFINTGMSINKLVGQGKRFIGCKMLAALYQYGQLRITDYLKIGIYSSDSKRGKKHNLWQPSFDWKYCEGEAFINQKLDYMHDNPCCGKWQLVESPVDYIHSSALFYITGEQGVYPVTHYMELDDVDLSAPNE
jgi:hypothetical protein